jgi:hypothetical protein
MLQTWRWWSSTLPHPMLVPISNNRHHAALCWMCRDVRLSSPLAPLLSSSIAYGVKLNYQLLKSTASLKRIQLKKLREGKHDCQTDISIQWAWSGKFAKHVCILSRIIQILPKFFHDCTTPIWLIEFRPIILNLLFFLNKINDDEF